MSMSAKDVIAVVTALVSLAIATMEHIERRQAESNTVEVARVLASAGTATAEGLTCP